MCSGYWEIIEPTPRRRADVVDNGDGYHPLGLPGLYCPVCNHTWGGTRVLPFGCPVEFQRHPNLVDRWPIPEDEHRALRDQLTSALRQAGQDVEALKPGDSFQPLEVKFSAHPTSDFLWAAIGGPVVSQRVKDAFEACGVTGVSFFPAHVTKVGRKKAPSITRPSRTMPVGNSELEEMSSLVGIEPLYEMLVRIESGRPPGAEIVLRCPRCGREEFDESKRQFVLTDAMIPSADVFYLATTLRIIVNTKVRKLIVDHGFTNVEFKEMEYIG